MLVSPVDLDILRFLRGGKFDAEIAVRTGMTIGDVKTRIEALRQRLGLPDRDALAAWEPDDFEPGPGVVEPPVDPVTQPQPWPEPATAYQLPLATEPPVRASGSSRLQLAFSGGLVAGALAAVLVVMFLGWDSPGRTPTRGPELTAPTSAPAAASSARRSLPILTQAGYVVPGLGIAGAGGWQGYTGGNQRGIGLPFAPLQPAGP
jgi:hypothetical protein